MQAEMRMEGTPVRPVKRYADREPTQPPPWHDLVVADVTCNNIATGTFLVAAMAELVAPETFSAVARFGYLVSLVFLLTDLSLLVLDLGDPTRFHHMLRVFKPSSPMSLGTWCLTAFSFPLALLVAVDLFFPPSWPAVRWIHVIAVLLALLPAMGSVAYKGVLFSTSAQPGWRDARWLGCYLCSSALALGCGSLLSIAVIMDEPLAVNPLRLTMAVLVGLTLVPLILLYGDTEVVIRHRWSPGGLLGIVAIAVGAGVVVPLCTALLSSEPFGLLSAAALLLAGSLAIRYVLVYLPRALQHRHAGGA